MEFLDVLDFLLGPMFRVAFPRDSSSMFLFGERVLMQFLAVFDFWLGPMFRFAARLAL